MRVKGVLLCVVAVFVLSVVCAGQDKDVVTYGVRPVPAADRTDLDISMTMKGRGEQPVTIGLPSDRFGVPKLHRFVTSISGEDGTRVEPGRDDSERKVYANARNEIHLRYRLSFDPKELEDFTYAPNVSGQHFHVAGCQWMLQIDGTEKRFVIKGEIAGLPRGWQAYSSISADGERFETEASWDDMIQTAIGAGRGGGQRFTFHGKPVNVFVRGRYSIPNSEILQAVRKIVMIQRDEFRDYDQPFYNVIVLPKDDNVAGVRFENMFISFFKADVTREQMYTLMAHEMAHNWFTGSIVKPNAGESPLRYAWFYEGVNDYFARKMLWKAGILTTDDFVKLVNRDLNNIADNPNRAASYDDAVKASKEGRYNQPFIKLSYYRGGLMGLLMDNGIHNGDPKRSLADLVRDVYSTSRTGGGQVTPDEIFAAARRYGYDLRGDFERFIVKGEPISLAGKKFCDAYELRQAMLPSFDRGFGVSSGKLTNVDPGKAAYKAGLRDGMEFVRMSNDNRFSNAWDPDLPLRVIVKDGGMQRTISFFPHGPAKAVFQLSSRSRNATASCRTF